MQRLSLQIKTTSVFVCSLLLLSSIIARVFDDEESETDYCQQICTCYYNVINCPGTRISGTRWSTLKPTFFAKLVKIPVSKREKAIFFVNRLVVLTAKKIVGFNAHYAQLEFS